MSATSQPQTLVRPPTPPSGQSTPTSAPGTPNSTTTSLSALSTTAIKDGHRGSAHPHAFPFPSSSSNLASLSFTTPQSPATQSNVLAAERADRISRLPGFGTTGNGGMRVKSTVGSASATGSLGRTTHGDGSSVVTEGSVTESEAMSLDPEGDRDSDVGTDIAVVGDGNEMTGERLTRGLETPVLSGGKTMVTPDEREGLGKFYFEEGKR